MREPMLGEDPRTEFRFCPRCGAGLESRTLQEGEPPRLSCVRCAFAPSPAPRVRAGALFHGEEGIFLVRGVTAPDQTAWAPPGAYVLLGETVAEAAVRAALEQTGLRVSPVGVLDVYSSAESDVVLVAYTADLLGAPAWFGAEGLEVAAFTPERVPWLELAQDSTRAALRDYLRRFFPRVRVPR
jgi:ADP-ribose pyrophosphatase YjhB (NUDIX family)